MSYLKEVKFNWNSIPDTRNNEYPYNIPSLRGLDNIKLESNVTFFVGENGSGKSTLLEAIARKCDFNIIGGKDSLIENPVNEDTLSSILMLSWFPKIKNGFFFRSETLFDFANYIDELANDPMIGRGQAYKSYGGKSLHEQSHGESFISLFTNRFGKEGIYILDEPEAALSPQNQLAFLRIIWQLEKESKAQFIIATHSPILLGYPDAMILTFDQNPIKKIDYESTYHYQVTKDFLNNRGKFFKYLFE